MTPKIHAVNLKYLAFFILVALVIGIISVVPIDVQQLQISLGIPIIFLFFALVMIYLLSQKPHLGLYFIAVWNPLQYLFTKNLGILPYVTIWFDDVTILLLAVFALKKIARNNWHFSRVPVINWFTIFFCLAVLSILWNQINAISTLAGLRSQLIYPLFFLAIIFLDFPEKVLKRFFFISVFMVLLQVPISIVQFVQGGVGQFNPDVVYGTFAQGYANIMGHYILIFVFIFMGLAFERTKYRAFYVLILGALSVSLVLTGSRAALLFLAIGGIIILGKRVLNIKIFVAATSTAIILTIIVFVYYQNRLGAYATDLNFKMLLAEQMDNTVSPGRLYYLFFTWKLIQEHWLNFLFGFGPASYASTAGSALRAPLLLRVTRNAYSPFIQSELVAVLGEYGILGTIALFGMYTNVFQMSIKSVKRLSDPFWRGIARGMIAISVYFLAFGVLVEKIWETQPIPYYYWFFAASIYLMAFRGNNRCSSQS